MGTGVIVAILVVGGIFVLMVLFSLAVPAYNRIRHKAEQVRNEKDLPALKPPAPLTAAQQEALGQYGQDLADALTDKDAAKVVGMQDGEGLASRAFEKVTDLPNVAAIRRGFVEGIQKREGGWMWALMEGEVTFLRTRERLGFPAVLVRLKTEEGGVNYIDVLVRPEGAGFKAVDMFNYAFATTASDDARNAIMSLVAKPGGSGLASMFGIPQMDNGVLESLQAINKATQAGDMAEVLRICDALPTAQKTQRTFFVLRLQALMALSSTGSDKVDAEYKQALRAAPGILGQDSTTDLLMVDLLFMENDFKGADECLKRVEAIVGGDAYLKFLRANAHVKMEDHEGALALANEAQKADPGMAEAVDVRLAVHLARKDHKAVVTELRHLREAFGATLDRAALADDGAYKEFLITPEFAAWEKEIAKP